jgi:AraC-like DNA-binding protein
MPSFPPPSGSCAFSWQWRNRRLFIDMFGHVLKIGAGYRPNSFKIGRRSWAVIQTFAIAASLSKEIRMSMQVETTTVAALDYPPNALTSRTSRGVEGQALGQVLTVLRLPIATMVKGGLAPWQLRRAQELIAAHVDGDLQVGIIAAQCGLSTGYFQRAFAKSTGQPPHRWLRNRRLERSKELLLGSGLSIAEIALECGFADQAHLTRLFGTAVGMGPGRWRRMNRC